MSTKAAAGVVSLLVALALFIYVVAFGGFNFDGFVFEPGCDWGNPNCEQEDYDAVCASFDGSQDNNLYLRYCKK